MEAGQTVASGFETPTLFTIAADLTKMQVVADVDEADIGGIEEGQRASFTVDAYPNDTFEGVVIQIRLGDASSTSSTSSSTSTVVTYEVVISAHNPDLKLKPRLTANITIYILDKKDVLSVPNKALRFTPEEPLSGKNDIVKDCESEHTVWHHIHCSSGRNRNYKRNLHRDHQRCRRRNKSSDRSYHRWHTGRKHGSPDRSGRRRKKSVHAGPSGKQKEKMNPF